MPAISLIIGCLIAEKIRGQVTWLALTNGDDPKKSQLKRPTPSNTTVIAPSFFDSKSQSKSLLFGASFIRNNTETKLSDDEHLSNFQKFSQALPNYCQSLNISKDTHFEGRVGIRAQTPDYHPLVGKISDSDHIFFVCTAWDLKALALPLLCRNIG